MRDRPRETGRGARPTAARGRSHGRGQHIPSPRGCGAPYELRGSSNGGHLMGNAGVDERGIARVEFHELLALAQSEPDMPTLAIEHFMSFGMAGVDRRGLAGGQRRRGEGQTARLEVDVRDLLAFAQGDGPLTTADHGQVSVGLLHRISLRSV